MRTVTYDTKTHKIVPIDPTDEMLDAATPSGRAVLGKLAGPFRAGLILNYKKMLAAAPDHPDTAGDAEDAHIEALLDAADEWAAYVEVDTAPMTLRKYLERAMRASKETS